MTRFTLCSMFMAGSFRVSHSGARGASFPQTACEILAVAGALHVQVTAQLGDVAGGLDVVLVILYGF